MNLKINCKMKLHMLKTAIDQNDLQIDLEYYKQSDELAMGAPTSAILAETYTCISKTWNTHKYTTS
jgi:hypothetical protein